MNVSWPADPQAQPRTSMNSQGNSYRRTVKQSDHADNSKKKEKRPVDAEVDLGLARNWKNPFANENAINKAYFYEDDANATEYLAKLENPEDHYIWVTSLIAAGIHINVGDNIAIEMRDRALQAHTSIPFPVLVTNLCRDIGDLEIERINENIWANQVIDITKIQDEMNPKLKKIKRELVVPHVSKTSMGIESQVVHDHVADAQSSSFDTPVAPSQPSVVAAWMELEHRVSELEGVGTREALAALKAGMSKVKTDVQQLQPDLSIFDAPLPEDEVLEDERAETNEEELEEEHVKKELDEERQVEMATQRSMDDVIALMVGAGPSSCAPVGEDVYTIENTTTTQSEEAKDV
ncbi:hypothetical protein HAX54_048425 [Datura stramonium]|uniref:Uncharacterized protein n=1 Tax=Datura stramonium TaxID=4076 RepID=A0ABS8RHT5_DATST|nr:hypothetical protein [Datura stramonium]